MQETLKRLRERRELGVDGGFTLIELLIVIVILGILAAIVVFAVQNLTGQSAQASCSSDYKTVESAAEVFKAQTGAYPGGTYNSSVTVTPSTATGLDAGVADLMGSATDSTSSDTFGPWLKDAPVNAGHYKIIVSTDGKGTISVMNSAGTTVTGCSAIS